MPASDTTLGSLLVRLLLDKSQFDKALKGAEKEIKDVSGTFDGLGDKLNRVVVGGFVAATAAVTAFAAGSLAMGSTFEYSITRVAAISGATADELAKMTKAARDIGIQTAFTATQASQAMEQLAQAGLKPAAVIAAAKNAVLLAGATGATMEQSTKLVVSTMEQFQLAASDTKRITDVFTKALNATTFDISSLTEAMKYAGVTGAGLGYTLEQTTAAVAMFRNLGLEGSLAGTAFKMAMADAAKDTKKQNDALMKYGLSMKDISSETHSFAEIMEKVGKAGITTSDAMTVFGVRAGAAVATIASQFGDGTTKFYTVQKALLDSAGTASETYTRMMMTVKGQFDIAMSSIQELFLVVFDQYKKPLAELLGQLAETINYVGDIFRQRTGYMRESLADLFGSWTKWLKANQDEIAAWFVMFVNAAVTIGKALAGILPYLSQIAAAFTAMFVASKVYAFVRSLQAVYEVLKAVTAATTAQAAAEAAASGGLIPLAAALVSIIAVLGTYAAAMLSATDAAESMAAAEKKIRDSTEAKDAELLAHVKTILPAQQARIAQILKEKSATGELTDEEVRRLQGLMALTAEQAAQKLQSGELVESWGELADVAGIIADEGNKGVDFIEAQAVASDEAAKAAREQGAALDKQIKDYEALTKKGVEYADMQKFGTEQYLDSADEMYAKRRALAKEEEDATAKATNLRGQAANEMTKERQEALADGKRTRAEGFQDEETVSAKELKAREAAAEKVAEIERELAEEVGAINRNEAGKLDVEEAKRIAKTRAAFDDELALYRGDATKTVEIAAEEERAIQQIHQIFDGKREDLRQDEAAKARKDLQERLQERFDAEAETMGKIQDLEYDQKHSTDTRLEALEAEHQMALFDAWQATDEQKARIDAVYGAKRVALERDIETEIADFVAANSRHPNSVKNQTRAIEEERKATLLKYADATQDDIADINAVYDKKISQAKVHAALDAAKKIKDAFLDTVKIVSGAVNTAFNTAYGYFTKITGLSLDLGSAMSDIQSQAGEAADNGETFDAARAGADLAQQMTDGAIGMVGIWVDAAPTFVQALVTQLPSVISAFAAAIPTLMSTVAAAIPQIVDALVQGVPKILQAFLDGLPALVDEILSAIPALIDMASRAVVMIINALPGLVEQVMDALPGIVTAILAAIPRIIRALLRAIPQIVATLIRAIPSIIVALIDGLGQILNVLARRLPRFVLIMVETLIENVPKIWVAFITTIVAKMPQIVVGFWKALIAGMWAEVKELGNFFSEIFKAALGWLADLFSKDGVFGKNGVLFGKGKDDVGFFKDIGQLFNGEKSDNVFASGLNYVPATMRVTVHPGETILPANRAARRALGTADLPAPPPMPGRSTGGAGFGALELSVVIGEQVVDQVVVGAMDRGRAPALARRIQRAAGVVKGYDRGKFNPRNGG